MIKSVRLIYMLWLYVMEEVGRMQEKVRLAFAMWRGVLDRLLYDEQVITDKQAKILENEFLYVLGVVFDIDTDSIANEVKRIIYSS